MSIAGLAYKLSLAIRQNPFRFLFRDFFMNLTDPYTDTEVEFLKKNWQGNVWDVGASVGKLAPIMAVANPNHKVFAFEPNFKQVVELPVFRVRAVEQALPHGGDHVARHSSAST